MAKSRHDRRDPWRWVRDVHFDRGFIARVEVPTVLGLVSYDRPSPWLRSVLTATPERALIREVVPIDQEPRQVKTTAPLFAEIRGWWRFTLDHLPQPLRKRDLWTGDVLWWRDMPTPTPFYATRDEAVTALGRAVVLWARERLRTSV